MVKAGESHVINWAASDFPPAHALWCRRGSGNSWRGRDADRRAKERAAGRVRVGRMRRLLVAFGEGTDEGGWREIEKEMGWIIPHPWRWRCRSGGPITGGVSNPRIHAEPLWLSCDESALVPGQGCIKPTIIVNLTRVVPVSFCPPSFCLQARLACARGWVSGQTQPEEAKRWRAEKWSCSAGCRIGLKFPNGSGWKVGSSIKPVAASLSFLRSWCRAQFPFSLIDNPCPSSENIRPQ